MSLSSYPINVSIFSKVASPSAPETALPTSTPFKYNSNSAPARGAFVAESTFLIRSSRLIIVPADEELKDTFLISLDVFSKVSPLPSKLALLVIVTPESSAAVRVNCVLNTN